MSRTDRRPTAMSLPVDFSRNLAIPVEPRTTLTAEEPSRRRPTRLSTPASAPIPEDFSGISLPYRSRDGLPWLHVALQNGPSGMQVQAASKIGAAVAAGPFSAPATSIMRCPGRRPCVFWSSAGCRSQKIFAGMPPLQGGPHLLQHRILPPMLICVDIWCLERSRTRQNEVSR